jgi:hypothetical protein
MQLYEWSERSERTNCICCCFCIDERSEAVSWFYCQVRCSCMNEVNCYCFVFVLLFDSLYSYVGLVLLPHRGVVSKDMYCTYEVIPFFHECISQVQGTHTTSIHPGVLFLRQCFEMKRNWFWFFVFLKFRVVTYTDSLSVQIKCI